MPRAYPTRIWGNYKGLPLQICISIDTRFYIYFPFTTRTLCVRVVTPEGRMKIVENQ